jgi:hypothetical protein
MKEKLVIGANTIIGILRIYFAYLGTTPAIKEFLTVPVTAMTMNTINIMFLILGLGGLIASIGLWLGMEWAAKALIAVSLVTILFDIGGYTIQSSAALGFIVPLLTLFMLYRSGRFQL